jgi:replicative DNA helicase
MSALQLAEAAALGALMLQPESIRAVSRWLRTGDFANPWHAELYTVLRERDAARLPCDPTSVGLALRDRIGPRRANLPHLVDLLQIVPTHPQPARYAALVLDASLRREVAQHGVLLRAGALSAALAGQASPLAAMARMVTDLVDTAERRWSLATSTPSAHQTNLAATAVAENNPRRLDLALGADRLLAAHPPVDRAAAAQHERRLVAALVTRPTHVSAVAAWLRTEHFVDRRWAAVYAAVVDLADTRQPVDAITVLWRVHQSQRRLGPGPDHGEFLRAVEAALTTHPEVAARAVAGDFTRRTADSAATSLTAAAANPGLDIRDVLGTARLLTDSVRRAGAGFPEHAAQHNQRRHLAPARADAAPSGMAISREAAT